jgi:hypothetical protein
MLIAGGVGQQLDGDPDDDRPADQLDVLHGQQLGHQERADHPDHDRPAGAEDDAKRALFPVEVLDRHGDDHGVVAGQHQVDENDAPYGQQKFPGKFDVAEPTHVNHGFTPFSPQANLTGVCACRGDLSHFPPLVIAPNFKVITPDFELSSGNANIRLPW